MNFVKIAKHIFNLLPLGVMAVGALITLLTIIFTQYLDDQSKILHFYQLVTIVGISQGLIFLGCENIIIRNHKIAENSFSIDIWSVFSVIFFGSIFIYFSPKIYSLFSLGPVENQTLYLFVIFLQMLLVLIFRLTNKLVHAACISIIVKAYIFAVVVLSAFFDLQLENSSFLVVISIGLTLMIFKTTYRKIYVHHVPPDPKLIGTIFAFIFSTGLASVASYNERLLASLSESSILFSEIVLLSGLFLGPVNLISSFIMMRFIARYKKHFCPTIMLRHMLLGITITGLFLTLWIFIFEKYAFLIDLSSFDLTSQAWVCLIGIAAAKIAYAYLSCYQTIYVKEKLMFKFVALSIISLVAIYLVNIKITQSIYTILISILCFLTLRVLFIIHNGNNQKWRSHAY